MQGQQRVVGSVDVGGEGYFVGHAGRGRGGPVPLSVPSDVAGCMPSQSNTRTTAEVLVGRWDGSQGVHFAPPGSHVPSPRTTSPFVIFPVMEIVSTARSKSCDPADSRIGLRTLLLLVSGLGAFRSEVASDFNNAWRSTSVLCHLVEFHRSGEVSHLEEAVLVVSETIFLVCGNYSTTAGATYRTETQVDWA
jgi:hypothetical protein